MTPSETRVVGIDLGTTNSLAAYVVDGKPQVVRDGQGNGLVPSVLCLESDGAVTVGTAAKRRAVADPTHTIFSVKRFMGRTLDDLKADLPLIPHQIVERPGPNGTPSLRVVIDGRDYSPEELSAMILREVRERAGRPAKAVITVPAYFDDTQRQATRDAGRIAGLDVLRIVNEPTAAALAYGLDRKANGTVAVYDLGGGTFDCSILSLRDGVFQVLATNGDTRLGGDDFDRLLMATIADRASIDLATASASRLQELRDMAERTKIALSQDVSSTVTIDGCSVEIARSDFESLIRPLVRKTIDRCKAAVRDAGLTVAEIDDVVLVGGSTRVPLVRLMVEEYFRKTPHCDLNPDEVVALGAAVQADILAGNRKDLLLLDVVPLSLGIETLGGVVDKIIHRNSPVPCRATMRYSTSADNQTAILVNVYQGERELAADCRPLGQFKLAGIPPMPAQFAQVEISFSVDANGLLTVSAVEKRSGQSMTVTVKAAHGLDRDEIERMVLESVDHARDDFAARQLIEFRNKARADLRHADKAMAQIGERLSTEQRTAIDRAKAELESCLAGTDHSALQRATVAFGDTTQPLAERLMNTVVAASLAGKTESEMTEALK
jgi:Fe-S protein assembly chaperone HscA